MSTFTIIFIYVCLLICLYSFCGGGGGGGDCVPGTTTTVELLFENEELVFRPSFDDFKEKMDILVESYMDTLSTVKRLIQNEELSEFFPDEAVDMEEEESFLDMLSDEELKKLVNDVKESLSVAFSQAEEFKTTFVPVKDIVIENTRMDIEKVLY